MIFLPGPLPGALINDCTTYLLSIRRNQAGISVKAHAITIYFQPKPEIPVISVSPATRSDTLCALDKTVAVRYTGIPDIATSARHYGNSREAY